MIQEIKERLDNIKAKIEQAAENNGRQAHDVVLIAVSKTFPVEVIKAGRELGLTSIGENKVQEAEKKWDEIKNSVQWHLVGHLQSNKAKNAVKIFDYIHSVDNKKLAVEVDKRARAINKIQNVLIQINTSGEESKSGVAAEEALSFISTISDLTHLAIRGLMTIGPFLPNPEEVRPCFKMLRELRDDIRRAALPHVAMDHLSMGMTNDFEVAIEEGATMVRIGRALFGERTYNRIS